MKLSKEEVAYSIIKMYFGNIARLGFKRRLDLDAVINAYLYTLKRLKELEKNDDEIEKMVEKTEAELANETKEELFPQITDKDIKYEE